MYISYIDAFMRYVCATPSMVIWMFMFMFLGNIHLTMMYKSFIYTCEGMSFQSD
jgi:hypothetical protein